MAVCFQSENLWEAEETERVFQIEANKVWAGACDHDRYAELNEIFKGLRKEALKKAEV